MMYLQDQAQRDCQNEQIRQLERERDKMEEALKMISDAQRMVVEMGR